MFALCRNMKWANLPNAGGLYDQDPTLLEKFEYIFQKLSEAEEKQQKKHDEEVKRQRNKSGRAAPRSTRMRKRF